jgi:hypothetical protein
MSEPNREHSANTYQEGVLPVQEFTARVIPVAPGEVVAPRLGRPRNGRPEPERDQPPEAGVQPST